MSAATVERRYVLTKVGRGDYLLPSNDGRTLWRTHTYVDGPSHGLDWPSDRTLWMLRKFDRPVDAETDTDILLDCDSWDRWEIVSTSHETRAEAINEALLRVGAAA